jgi:hypothetical protein
VIIYARHIQAAWIWICRIIAASRFGQFGRYTTNRTHCYREANEFTLQPTSRLQHRFLTTTATGHPLRPSRMLCAPYVMAATDEHNLQSLQVCGASLSYLLSSFVWPLGEGAWFAMRILRTECALRWHGGLYNVLFSSHLTTSRANHGVGCLSRRSLVPIMILNAHRL